MQRESPLTPEQLIDRVLDSFNGVEVNGERRDVALALLHAGRTTIAVALRQLSEVERERWLLELEDHLRQLLDAWGQRAAHRRLLN